MIRIRIFSSFSTSSEAMRAYISIHKLFEDPEYNKVFVFTDDDNYTHAFIQNIAMPQNLNIPKENVIGFAFEPLPFLHISPDFIEYAKKHIGVYYIGDTATLNLPAPFTEGYAYMWHSSISNTFFIKDKIMSIIISDKMMLFGHQYRHTLVKRILASDLPIDIYGRGVHYYKGIGDIRIKSEFENTEPYDTYMFHIAVENIQHPEYFSEKIINPLVSNTNVLYYGCSNIHNYYPNNVLILTGNIDQDMKLITDVCRNHSMYYKPVDMNHIKTVLTIKNPIYKHFL